MVRSPGMTGEPRASFFSLTPDRVLDAVEVGGLRCTGRCLPLRAFENRVYEVELEDERRLVVKPGVTCLWQISGRSHLSFEEWMALDNAYIDSWSPWYDLAIVAKTIPTVVWRRGAY